MMVDRNKIIGPGEIVDICTIFSYVIQQLNISVSLSFLRKLLIIWIFQCLNVYVNQF